MSSAILAGQNIKHIAKNKGISVSRMLKECKLGKDLVSDMVRNNSMPSADKLDRIADYLNVSTKDLLINNENNTNEKENEGMVDGKNEYEKEFEDVVKYLSRELKKAVKRGDTDEICANLEINEKTLTQLINGDFGTNITKGQIRKIENWLNLTYPQTAYIIDYFVRLNQPKDEARLLANFRVLDEDGKNIVMAEATKEKRRIDKLVKILEEESLSDEQTGFSKNTLGYASDNPSIKNEDDDQNL